MNTVTPPELAEDKQTLWLLVISPSIWAAHFLISYAAGAIWCGPIAGRGGAAGPLYWGVAGLTAIALIGIGLTGRLGWTKHSHGEGKSEPPHDQDTPEDRHRFLGFATVLLSWLSAVATVYVAIAVLLSGGCR